MNVISVKYLKSPNVEVGELEVMQVELEGIETWMTPILSYLTVGTKPIDPIEARKLRMKAAKVDFEGTTYGDLRKSL